MLDPRTNLTLSSAGRILVGLAMLIAPKRIGEGWLGAGGRGAESAALMRVAGIRDAAFGVGGLIAARNGRDPRPWLAASVVVDGTDAYATLKADGVPAANKAPAIAIALGAALGSLFALLQASGEDD